ncbi:cobalt-precorrin 5A hydrolase [Selenihalanaerobacter shriftii]|uniref:Cobalt-precorrin 5A acetaldehyde-lyase n=1 Tax=Selenihalanaerobacter shriftii TaxID=142842 RepID=A0A1T4K487_9FIRM|nr:cobalt-precorrin 5A hydrolase [Selenihalanaerobacter shriftii]SJZ37153.1 cobalt-precorrin 5A acetaldehyde-lyase [Selenihalanaerobacter shriftii]
MKLAIMAVTKGGLATAKEIADSYSDEVDIFISDKLGKQIDDLEGINQYSGRLKGLVEDIFDQYDGLIFVMALGIVVRVIAGILDDKRSDPAVITIDETKEFVISTLSGHLGGANELAVSIANLINAKPVVTTATDCQNKLAIDMVAKKLNCEIEPFSNLTRINAAIVNDKEVNIFTDYELDLELTDNMKLYPLTKLGEVSKVATVIISNQQLNLPAEIKKTSYLWLKPRNLVVGIGCRRGISKDKIEKAVRTALTKIDKNLRQVRFLATIDLKANEEGLLEYAKENEFNLNIISREEIKATDLEFTTSEFVKKIIGVGGVCEPVALLSGKRMELLLKKQKLQGVTVAIAEERFM